MINFAVVGMGNYGAVHLDAARKVADAGLARFAAAADVRLDAFPDVVAELQARGVACYDGLETLLDAHPELDLVNLPLPIQLHKPLTVACLERGLNVLVEKPPAPTLAEAEAMAAAARRTGKLCGVGFQFSTSPLLRAIRGLLAAGKLGEITALHTMSLGKRYDNYYARAGWAGKIRVNGVIVRDGTLNNPYAHMAQLLLTVAADAAGAPVRPVSVQSELFAGHDIETEDTCALRATLSSGPTLHFVSSVCTHLGFSQHFRIEGTRGVITYDSGRDPKARVDYTDGTGESLPNINDDTGDGTSVGVFRNMIAALEGREPLACPIDATLAFADLVEQTFAGDRVIHLHGTPHVMREELVDHGAPEVATYLAGIEEYARQAYAQGRLYSEVGAAWAK